MEFWASRRSKYMKNLTFCHFFELQKAVLGELVFDRANELQIQKFQLSWKVDSQTFPTSPLLLNLATCKYLKQSCECARPVKQGGATSQAVFCQIALYSPENADLTQFDFLGWKMIIFDVIIVTLRQFYSCLTLLEDSFM